MKIRGGVKIALLLLVFLIIYLRIKPDKPELLNVTFLDVGQGDASLIETPYGQNILIDAGEGNAVIKRLGEELPWWDKTIDLMILTHPHSDHLGGMIDVLRRFDVSGVIYTGAVSHEADFNLWLELVKDEEAEITIIDHPQRIKFGEGCYLEIIFPFEKKDISEQKNLNNTSLVAKLIYKETDFLFMGDAETEVEEKLIKEKIDLKAEVLKAGHHGSDTSNSEDFLKNTSMAYMVISVGKDNDFGHPSLRVLRRLERASTKMLRTDLDGSIRMTSDGNFVSILK